ncbi:MAG: 4Fe-4S dicluster domain-containing protein [Nitrospirae bacterium]|nr:MAG: 4Fe-4S dicluster domain-containing protein [Nitrospirota bacterium]
MKGIFININRCTGCKSCEIACAVTHSKNKDLFSAITEFPPPRKRVYVEPVDSYAFASRCMHCKDAPCIIACPNGAMHKDEERGFVLVNEEKCMGCMMCAMVCPFGAITLDLYRGKASKCDFCIERMEVGKEPACVEACPTGALQYGELEELVRQKRRSIAYAVLIASEEVKKEGIKISE